MNAHEQWIPSGAAIQMLLQRSSHQRPGDLVLRRLSAGVLTSKALRFEAPDRVHQDYQIPKDFWREVEPWLGSDHFLGPGDFDFRLDGHVYRIFGLAMRRAEIEAMCDPDPSDHATKLRGGRPSAPWWDDFWIFVATELYFARFEPESQSQADLERLMLDWAAYHGHPLSESHATAKARKLMSALREGKNPSS